MIRKNILLLAYSVSPTRGSEYSVGWNYITEMSRDHNLIVLYGLAGDHMGDLDEVALSPACKSLKNVDWVPIRPNWFTNFLNTPNRNGFLVYSFYLAYKFWHKQAYRVAREMVQSRNIDLIHYLCPIGYREPGYLWNIDKPYIWGPVGGIDNRSAKLVLEKSYVTATKVAIRNIVNSSQFRLSPRVNKAFKRANLVLASTSKTQSIIKRIHNIDSIVMPENAITDEMLARQRTVSVEPHTKINIIWVGRIDEAKSLDILIQAMAPLKRKSWHLNVIGDGPSKAANIQLAIDLDISGKISWAGKLPRKQVDQHYQEAHLHVITSLFEANTTVIWEAMSFGIPTVALDHFGMHDTVSEKCGVKVSPIGPLSSVVDDLTIKISRLIDNPAEIEKLSEGVKLCSDQYTWHQRRTDWNQYYDAAIQNWELCQESK